MKKIILTPFFILLITPLIFSQSSFTTLDYNYPRKLAVRDIIVTGVKSLDPEAISALSGIQKGDIIDVPGDQISYAIKKIWKEKLVDNVNIEIEDLGLNEINLYIKVSERPRLGNYTIYGIGKGAGNSLGEELALIRGSIVSQALIKNTKSRVKNHYLEDGFFNTKVRIEEVIDTLDSGFVNLKIHIDKGKKVKIEKIDIIGNHQLEEEILKRKLKKTKERKPFRVFKRSKYIKEDYIADKQLLIDYYQANGFRDIRIIKDSINVLNEKRINLNINVYEGKQYKFGKINWKGNYVYDDKKLNNILNIKEGEIYNQKLLNERLRFNTTGQDVSSLYLNNGYLFFNVIPIESSIHGDTIDIEMHITEGKQALISKILISGNTKTNDHVILREIRSLPGQKFSRENVSRSMDELRRLGYFDPMLLDLSYVPNLRSGTVDLEYKVVEKPNDQIQLSGGWGGPVGFVGTAGIIFNNFSLKNINNLKNWKPLPAGDGQRLSIQMRANGRSFQNYSISFTEPWLGGRKPNSFTVSLNRSIQRRITDGETIGHLKLSGASISLGKRLRIPDDYFTLVNSLSYNRYNLENYNTGSLCSDCIANNISFNTTLSRNNIGSNPQFPTRGGSTSLSLTLTPPYSMFDRSIINLTGEEQYELIEFHKWMLDNSWFFQLTGNMKNKSFNEKSKTRPLVLNVRNHLGFIGAYTNRSIGPFERFNVGGDGLSGFNFLLGSDVIGLRGYGNNSLPNEFNSSSNLGGTVYSKLVSELRYPLITESMTTIYTVAFLEAGNSWKETRKFNPFELYRSAGLGVRIFMPAFGMIGVDYGYGFDELKDNNGIKVNGGQFHFTIGQQIR